MNQQTTRQANTHPRKESKKNTNGIITLVIACLFIAGIFGYAFIFKDNYKLQIISFPADWEGHVCALQYPQSYRFLFIDLNGKSAIARCVNQCPSDINANIIQDSNFNNIAATQAEWSNQKLGGICMSPQKYDIIKSDRLQIKLNLQQAYFNKFDDILLLLGLCFVFGFLNLLLFFYFPIMISYLLQIVLAGSLLIAAIIYLLGNVNIEYRWCFICLSGLILTWLILSIAFDANKLKQSLRYSQKLMENIKCYRIIKIILTVILFSIANGCLLIAILYHYLWLASTEQLKHQANSVYYATSKTFWKYICLAIQWLFLSNLLQNIYSYCLVYFGYQINENQSKIALFSFQSFLVIIQHSFVQTVLWLPLKLALFKPNGATTQQGQQINTFNLTVTKACYCLFGAVINWLHKYTFNPYLVMTIDGYFHNLDICLKLVQKVYHIEDSSYDKSSLWIYKLSNYIIIVIASLLFLTYFSQSFVTVQNNVPMFLLINFLAMVISTEIAYYLLTVWTTLTEVTQFILITKKESDFIF